MNEQHLITVCCDHFEITRTEFFSKRQTRPIVKARRFAMAVLNDLEYKPQLIAEIIGRKRPTVLFHLDKHKDFMETYEDYREEYENVKKLVI